jgi:hypothetical protein
MMAFTKQLIIKLLQSSLKQFKSLRRQLHLLKRTSTSKANLIQNRLEQFIISRRTPFYHLFGSTTLLLNGFQASGNGT